MEQLIKTCASNDLAAPLAPQVFLRKGEVDPAIKSLILDSKREELKSLIASIAITVCGFKSREQLSEQLADKNAAGIAKMRRDNGYTLVDREAFYSADPARSDLVTVFFAKSAKSRDLLVPIIVAHEHPEGFSQRIKDAVEAHFVKVHGGTPTELAKSSTVRAIEKVWNYRKWICTALAVGAFVGAGIAKGPGIVQAYNERREAQAQAEAAQAKVRAEEQLKQYIAANRSVLEAIEKNSEAVAQGLVSPRVVMTSYSQAQYEGMLNLLEVGDAADKERVLKVLEIIGQEMCDTYWTYRDHRGPTYVYLPVESSIIKMIKNEKNPQLRTYAADVLYKVSHH